MKYNWKVKDDVHSLRISEWMFLIVEKDSYGAFRVFLHRWEPDPVLGFKLDRKIMSDWCDVKTAKRTAEDIAKRIALLSALHAGPWADLGIRSVRIGREGKVVGTLSHATVIGGEAESDQLQLVIDGVGKDQHSYCQVALWGYSPFQVTGFCTAEQVSSVAIGGISNGREWLESAHNTLSKKG